MDERATREGARVDGGARAHLVMSFPQMAQRPPIWTSCLHCSCTRRAGVPCALRAETMSRSLMFQRARTPSRGESHVPKRMSGGAPGAFAAKE